MEANIRTARWITQLRIKLTLDWLHETIVSMSARLMLMLSYDMKKEQMSKLPIYISRHSVSLHFNGEQDFQSELKYSCFFYKQQVYKQLPLGWQVANQFSGPNPLSLSNNTNNRLKKSGTFSL